MNFCEMSEHGTKRHLEETDTYEPSKKHKPGNENVTTDALDISNEKVISVYKPVSKTPLEIVEKIKEIYPSFKEKKIG